eukprot:TRINITY_DN34499_c0_g2_i1.p1 TRINITY_DN34499_c0_g2~~TRINITY_DN34499_c0_g2_i1.p1  ORF type:complete len:696 (+),score=78.25 TRINITY_DN34499_c0_g2_i1:93-2180(+)
MAANSAQSSDADGSLSGEPLFALLLNDATKDEGEEFLDYHFPAEGPEVTAILAMKGVLLASCGVMRAAVGQKVSFFVFRSAEKPSVQYKACFQQIEKWYLCVILPGAISDRIAHCLMDEATSLISLKHGRLSSLQGYFRQLDQTFRALGRLSRGVMQINDDGCGDAGCLYLALGVVLWSSWAEAWREEIRGRMSTWESVWAASCRKPLAKPEGFVLLLDQTLVATSLTDLAFDACLRLCLLECVFDGRSAWTSTGSPNASLAATPNSCCDNADVRCHSLFLSDGNREPSSCDANSPAGLLPSHQYSIIRCAPWVLFMLWRMSSTSTSFDGSSGDLGGDTETVTKSPSGGEGDPFGIDLCLELLLSFPNPQAQTQTPRETQDNVGLIGGSGRAGSSSSPPTSSTAAGVPAGAARSGRNRSFSLSGCPVWKPLVSRGSKLASSRRASGECAPSTVNTGLQRRPWGIFLHTLEMQDGASTSADVLPSTSARCSFAETREPRRAARDRLIAEDFWRVRCPELAARAAARKCLEFPSTGCMPLLAEWGELEWLAQAHSSRQKAWKQAPSLALSRHVLVNVMKDVYSVDRLWNDCFEEGGHGGGDFAAAGGNNSSIARGGGTPATVLGCGETWRFQVGAPFYMSDLSPIVSMGARTRLGQHHVWVAMSRLLPLPGGSARSMQEGDAKEWALLHLDTMGEAA